MDIVKARSSVAAARLCLAHGHADSAGSRAYYGMFQAAQVAVERAGFGRGEWTHAGLQATFANELTRRRKLLPGSLAGRLQRALRLRITADYTSAEVSRSQATRVLAWADEFLARIEEITRHGQATPPRD
jgi:uncharacterized protein (UPF0332 family)